MERRYRRSGWGLAGNRGGRRRSLTGHSSVCESRSRKADRMSDPGSACRRRERTAVVCPIIHTWMLPAGRRAGGGREGVASSPFLRSRPRARQQRFGPFFITGATSPRLAM
ncbi:hypothetical protein FQA47_018234 [Oryzias melastigma]|uniref:Uncharacterized protein n=1 Tax=Oryzias melastigma TaxID=30732 RepID=A0A834FRY1_ORYME|nr:hypothetical protein FQA47_018234 [Oryzias melastigma]